MRQKPIGDYVVDFYCTKLKLVIEIDGSSHFFKYKKDVKRHRYLESLGLYLMRFDDIEIKADLQNILDGILYWIEEYERKEREKNPLFIPP